MTHSDLYTGMYQVAQSITTWSCPPTVVEISKTCSVLPCPREHLFLKITIDNPSFL